MRLIPKDEFYESDTEKGFFKLVPKEEFYAPKPYPTEPSLFGITPERILPEFEPPPEIETEFPSTTEIGKAGLDVLKKVNEIDKILSKQFLETTGKIPYLGRADIAATEFIESIGRAAKRKVVPPAFDNELDSRRHMASELPHEEAVEWLIRGEPEYGTRPMPSEEAEQFVTDQKNLDLIENLTLLGLIGYGVYQGVRSIPAVWRALRQDFSRYLWEEVPRESMTLAERIRRSGISVERLAEIQRGAKPTEKELEKIERISQPRKLRGIGDFLKKWFGTEKPPEPFVARELPGQPTPEAAPKVARPTLRPPEMPPEAKPTPPEMPEIGKELVLRPKEPIPRPTVAPGEEFRVPPKAVVPPKPEAPKISIVESTTYKGERKTPVMGPKDEMLVAQDRKGNDLGYLWYTKEADGFTVRKVETGVEGFGVGRELYREAHKKAGPYRGSTGRTEEGVGFIERLRETEPEIFAEEKPIPRAETEELRKRLGKKPGRLEQNWKDQLVGKLREKEVKSLSDAEIEGAFKDTVGEVKNIEWAKKLRDKGILTVEDIAAEPTPPKAKEPWEMTRILEDENIKYTAQYHPKSDIIKVNPTELEKLSMHIRYEKRADEVALQHERLHAFWDKYLSDIKKPNLLDSLKNIKQSNRVDPTTTSIGERAIETLTVYKVNKNLLNPQEISWAEKALSEGKPVPPEVLADYPDLGKLRPTTVMEAELKAKEIERRKGFPIKKKEPKEIRTSRQAILKYIEKQLKVPIRIGRFRQRAMGVYKETPQVVRLKKPLDVEVAAHEIGHHLQRVLGLTGEMPEEIQTLAYPGAKSKSKEGFAEFMRFYLTDEAKARKSAPAFYKTLDDKLYDFPDIRDSLIQVRQAWNEWRMLASQDKVGSVIETGKRDKRLPTINQLYTMIVDEIRPLENLKTIAEEKRGEPLSPANDPFTLAWLTRGWARKAENFLKYGTFQLTPDGVKFTGPSLKEILKPMEDAGERHLLDRYLVAKRALSDQRILDGFEGILSKGDFQVTVKELEPKFKEVAEKLYAYQDELLEYLVDSGRISDQTRNAIKKKNLFYAPFYRLMDVDEPALGLSRKKFGNLFQPIKRLKGSARVIISPTENIIKNTFGIINAAERNRVGEALINLAKIEGIGKWIEKLPVRIKPVMIPTEQLQYVLRRYGKWRETVTYREIKKELGDIIGQVEGKTPAEKVENVAIEALQHRGWTEAEAKQILERLKTAKTIKERDNIIEKVIEKTAITEIIREYGFDITDPAVAIFRPNYRTKPNEVIFYDRGEAKVYELDSDIYRAVMSLDGDSLGTLVKVFAYPAKWLRAGAVRFSVEFAMKNPVRDQFTAMLYSKYGYKAPFDFIRGIYHMFNRDELWQKFNASGAAHASMVSMDRDYVHKTYKDFAESIGYRDMVSFKGISKMVKNPLLGLQMLTELTEEATRVGEFARGLKKEGETLDGVLEAGKAARDIILDFQRIGTKMRAYNAIVAFQNAGIQGLDKMRRAFWQNPGKTSLKAFLYLTLPTILLWWAQKDDPAYQELPYWRKILCWNIVTHNEDGSVKHIWWIPKPFEIGIIFGSIPEAALEWAYRQDPQAFKETAKELIRVLNPGVIPTALTPIMEWFANKSWFFDRPIVPRGKEELSPELQYTPYTPESVKLLAKGMAKVPAVKEFASPAKITNLIRGYTGSFGYMTLESIDEILKRTGIVDPPIEPMKKISEYPGLRVFTQRWPMGNARSIEDFYREYEKMETHWGDMRQRARIRGLGLKIKTPPKLEQYRKTAQTLSGMRKVATIIYESERPAEEKRMILDSIYLSMINISRVQMGRKPIPIPKIKKQMP